MVEVCCTQLVQYHSIQYYSYQSYLRRLFRSLGFCFPEVVRSRFLKLNREHILYVMEAMQRNTTQVANIRAYTLSALYNAPGTIGQYCTSQVSHDMAQGWEVGRSVSIHLFHPIPVLPSVAARRRRGGRGMDR